MKKSQILPLAAGGFLVLAAAISPTFGQDAPTGDPLVIEDPTVDDADGRITGKTIPT